MKFLVILFLFTSFASKNTKNGGDDCKTNDVVIEFENLEHKTENVPKSNENNATIVPIEIISTAQKKRNLTVGEISTKQILSCILNYLENADYLALFNANSYFRNLLLVMYKEQIRGYPSETQIDSFDQILCLSAVNIGFQRAFREEIAESQPIIPANFYHYAKRIALKIPNCDEYINSIRLNYVIHDIKKSWKTCSFQSEHPPHKYHCCPNFPGPNLKYAELAQRRMEIVGDALEKVNKYNLTRQKPKTLTKNAAPNLFFMFLLFLVYVPFLVLPFDSKAGEGCHWLLGMYTLTFNFYISCCHIPPLAPLPYNEGFFAQVPKPILVLYKIFGVATGIFNFIGTLPECRSFLTYVLTAVFIGSFYFLPFFFILLRAGCRQYICKPTAPREIREAKENIRKIQQSFFIDI